VTSTLPGPSPSGARLVPEQRRLGAGRITGPLTRPCFGGLPQRHVTILLVQYVGSRVLSQFILANANPLPGPGWRPRNHLRVYQPHEAKEDTVVFPPFAGPSPPGNSLTSDGSSPAWSVSSPAGDEFSAMVSRDAGIDTLALAVQAAKAQVRSAWEGRPQQTS